MKKFATALLVAAMFGLAACNTMEGLGRDVSSVGQTVEGAAR